MESNGKRERNVEQERKKKQKNRGEIEREK